MARKPARRPPRAGSNGRRPNDDIGEEMRLQLYHSQFRSGRPSSAPTTCSCRTS
jgi:hypothetical protein